MVNITINDVFIHENTLELRYTIYLSKISDSDLETSYDCLNDRRLGYDKYFNISEEAPTLSPYTTTTLNGKDISASKTTVTETESLESARTICVSEHYDISGLTKDVPLCGTLSIADIDANFNMNEIQLENSPQEASGGNLVEIDGLKLLCVPTIRDNTLFIDYYACEPGEYTSTKGFRGWYNTDILTINGKEIEGKIDESYKH